MNKQIENFTAFSIEGDNWGHYVDIEHNYPTIKSTPFPFSTSKTNSTPKISPKQIKKYYDIEFNKKDDKPFTNNTEKYEFSKKKEDNQLSDFVSNFNLTNIIIVSVITYVAFFIA